MLWELGSIAQNKLSHTVCVDKSSLSRVLDVMERRWLVTRKRSPDDARRKILYPTVLSDQFRTHSHNAADVSMRQILRNVPEDEHEICLKVLARVKQTLRELSEES